MKQDESIMCVVEYDGTEEGFHRSGNQLKETFEQLPVKALVPVIMAAVYVFIDKTDINTGMHVLTDLISSFIVLQTTLADDPAELEAALDRIKKEIREMVLVKSAGEAPTGRPN